MLHKNRELVQLIRKGCAWRIRIETLHGSVESVYMPHRTSEYRTRVPHQKRCACLLRIQNLCSSSERVCLPLKNRAFVYCIRKGVLAS